MNVLTFEEIEQRKNAGIKMNRLNCGWNLSNEQLAEISTALNKWKPKTFIEKRDKEVCYLAFIKNMNASQIVRTNNPLFVGAGNRSKGKPLSATSILSICYKYFPFAKNRHPKKSKAAETRNNLFKDRQHGKITKPKICSTCGSVDNLELHHIIPLSVGGTNDYFNLIYLCHNCHRALHNAVYKQFEIPKKVIIE